VIVTVTNNPLFPYQRKERPRSGFADRAMNRWDDEMVLDPGDGLIPMVKSRSPCCHLAPRRLTTRLEQTASDLFTDPGPAIQPTRPGPGHPAIFASCQSATDSRQVEWRIVLVSFIQQWGEVRFVSECSNCRSSYIVRPRRRGNDSGLERFQFLDRPVLNASLTVFVAQLENVARRFILKRLEHFRRERWALGRGLNRHRTPENVSPWFRKR
jgi:hypothetical protein